MACLWHTGDVVAVSVTWEGEAWDLGEDRGIGWADGEDHSAGVADGFVGGDGEELVLIVGNVLYVAVSDVCDWLFVDETIQEVVALSYAVAVVGEEGQ